MSILRVLIVAFCLFGSSVLFFSIGKWSNDYIFRDDSTLPVLKSSLTLHLIGSDDLVLPGKTIRLVGLINGRRMVLEKKSDVLGYVEFSDLNPGHYLWIINTVNSENKAINDSIYLSAGQELTKTIIIEKQ